MMRRSLRLSTTQCATTPCADIAAATEAELWGLRAALAAQEAQLLRGHADGAALSQARRDAATQLQVGNIIMRAEQSNTSNGEIMVDDAYRLILVRG